MRPGLSLIAHRGKGLRLLAGLCFCAISFGIFAAPASAQSQTAVNAHMELFQRLTLTLLQDMDFGSIAGSSAGTVVMTATTAPTCTASAGLVHSGVCHAARFGGAGQSGQIVRIKKPPSNKIILTGPGTNMEITNLVLNGTPQLVLVQATSGYSRYRIADPNGLFAFRLAGTLNVGANQTPGVYTGTFQVDIQYN